MAVAIQGQMPTSAELTRVKGPGGDEAVRVLDFRTELWSGAAWVAAPEARMAVGWSY